MGEVHTLRGRAVEPPFACAPLRIVRDRPVAERLGIEDRRRRYFAEGEFVIVTSSRRRMSTETAFEEAQHLLAKSIDPTMGSLADSFREELEDLILALRAAIENGSPPPATVAEAA